MGSKQSAVGSAVCPHERDKLVEALEAGPHVGANFQAPGEATDYRNLPALGSDPFNINDAVRVVTQGGQVRGGTLWSWIMKTCPYIARRACRRLYPPYPDAYTARLAAPTHPFTAHCPLPAAHSYG